MTYKVYTTAYKAAYVVLVVANLFTLYATEGFHDRVTWLIGCGFGTVNVLAWILFVQGFEIGRKLEQLLSIGRVVVIALSAFIFFEALVALYSPVGLVLWLPLARESNAFGVGRFAAWWLGCGLLLMLELFYFRFVSHSD